jgi:hypothetical protein
MTLLQSFDFIYRYCCFRYFSVVFASAIERVSIFGWGAWFNIAFDKHVASAVIEWLELFYWRDRPLLSLYLNNWLMRYRDLSQDWGDP